MRLADKGPGIQSFNKEAAFGVVSGDEGSFRIISDRFHDINIGG